MTRYVHILFEFLYLAFSSLHTLLSQKTSLHSQSEKPFAWRMQQPDPSKKYQLFPKEKRLPVLNSNKGADSEKATMAPAAASEEKADSQPLLNGLKKRLNQHSLARRRKISVPEVGPMTTVQELSMDSRMCSYLRLILC